MRLVFERKPHVYLPEISAYLRYVDERLPHVQAWDSGALDDYDPLDFDVVWRFMGLDIAGTGRRIIHEYNSLSTGRFARLKNRVKQTTNVRPDGRVFLNAAVRGGFWFPDAIPFRERDMGVADSFFETGAPAPVYDFVYAGSLDRGDTIVSALEHFKTTLTDATFLVIGGVPDAIHERYGAVANIVFTGRVPCAAVPDLIAQARYGLNLMPDRYPFSLQTATKVLEYCAAGLPVVSTDYRWIRKFERERGARFFFLEKDWANLTMAALERHPFQVPCVDDCAWNEVIARSGVFDLLG
ncbi:MAG: glycosyltransferase [Alphaproteobacteria bacterium]|nr:glycosyltransferase [Alphaproteobacteria bacterium]